MLIPSFLVECSDSGHVIEYALAHSDQWTFKFETDWPWGEEKTPEEEAEEIIALQPFHAMAVKIIALTGVIVTEESFLYWES